MNTAFVYRIEPTFDQQILINKTFGCRRFIYNKMLEDKINYYKAHQTMLKTYPSKYKDRYVFLNEVDATALVSSQNDLDIAYKNFFKKQETGFPRFKKYSFSASYTTLRVNDNIRIEGEYLKLPKLGLVKIKLHRQIPNNHKIKNVTIRRSAGGKYSVSILTEYLAEIKQVTNIRDTIGLDYSLNKLFVSLDETCSYPVITKWTSMIEKLNRRLSHTKKDSNNRLKLKLRLGRVYDKITNIKKDFLHKKSTEIANRYDLVSIENLNLKSMTETNQKSISSKVFSTGWGMFKEMLSYKLKLRGKHLEIIPKYYPSSKTCCHCGQIQQELRLSDRVFKCPSCSNVLDRDINASINISIQGMIQYAKNLIQRTVGHTGIAL